MSQDATAWLRRDAHSLDEAAARRKAFLAERSVAWVRMAVVLFNVVFYWGWMDKAGTHFWLALGVTVVATLYGSGVLLLRPYEHFPVMRSAMFTAVTDGALITLWVSATGGYESPFYLLWYLSLVAVVFRYDSRATVIATLLYIAAYAGLLLFLGDMVWGAFVVRGAYIALVGALGALLARESFKIVRDQVEVAQEARDAGRLERETALLRAVTQATTETNDPVGALRVAVEGIAKSAGWHIGEAWMPEGGRMVRALDWTDQPSQAQGILDAGAGLAFSPGEGLPGNAWRTQAPFLDDDVGQSGNVVRGKVAAKSGFHGAVAIPLVAAGNVAAVLLFFMDRLTVQDQRFAELVFVLGPQFHNLLERKRAEQQLRESEHRYQTLAEGAFEGIALVQDGHVVEANDALCNVLGRPEEELLGLPVLDLVPEQARRDVKKHLEAAAGRPLELHLKRPDGILRIVEVIVKETQYQGEAVRSLAVIDITERKAAEEAKRKSREQELELRKLRDMDQFKTDFINMAAHELNTPLTPMKLQLHLLGKAVPDRDGRGGRAVAVLSRNLERLVGLVADMLEVARMQSGRLAMEPEPVDLTRALRETEEAFGPNAKEVGVKLKVESVDAVVFVDRQRLLQVLFNLLSNALKFTPRGGSVTLRAQTRDKDVEIQVEDTGIGLSQDQISRLFQPFSQVHDKTNTRGHGTGLGLYICKGIVEAAGGQIGVRSAGEEQGSTFHFSLPRSKEAPSPARDETPKQKGDRLAQRLRELM